MLAERWCFLWSRSSLVTEGKGEGEASLTSVSSVTSSVRSKPQAKVSSLEKLASQCPESLSQGTGKCWVSQVVHHGGGHQCLPAPGKAVWRERELMGTLTTLQHRDLELRLPSREQRTEFGNKASACKCF